LTLGAGVKNPEALEKEFPNSKIVREKGASSLLEKDGSVTGPAGIWLKTENQPWM